MVWIDSAGRHASFDEIIIVRQSSFRNIVNPITQSEGAYPHFVTYLASAGDHWFSYFSYHQMCAHFVGICSTPGLPKTGQVYIKNYLRI